MKKVIFCPHAGLNFYLLPLVLMLLSCGHTSKAERLAEEETKFQLAVLNGSGKILFAPHSCREKDADGFPTKWGVMTIDGKYLLDGEEKWLAFSEYTDALDFTTFPREGAYAAFGVKGKSGYGILDYNLDEVVAPQYVQLKISGAYAIGQKPGTRDYEVIHLPKLTTHTISNPQFSLKEVQKISDGTILLYHDGKPYFTDLEGKTIIVGGLLEKANIVNPFYEGLAALEVENPDNEMSEVVFINKTGKKAFDKSFAGVTDYFDEIGFSDGRAVVEGENGKYGVIDTSGSLIVDHLYDYIQPFKDGQTEAGILIDADNFRYKKYRIDKNGKILGEVTENSTRHPADEWRSYREDIDERNWLEGYENEAGEIMIPAQFEEVFSFHNGYAIVRKDGKIHLIDSKGNYVIKNLADNVGPVYGRG